MEAMKLYGIALKDYLNGIKSVQVTIIRDDDNRVLLPVNGFFRCATEFEIDRIALEHCRDKFVEIGAGTLQHALY